MSIHVPSNRVRFIGLRVVPLVLILALVTFFLPTAGAVHLEGNLELDVPSANVTNGGPSAGEDWENICYEVTGDSDCGTSTGSTADDVAWAEDGAGTSDPSNAPAADSSSIFTGGGSKDTDEIANWAYKNDGGLPDKDNILHAFAAKYGDFLYFGMDRWSNDGDAQLGFWFFKNTVSLTSTKSGGGFEFDGDHTPGDLLILSDFSNGGTVSTIKVYEWQEPCASNCASTNLHIIADSEDPASCDGADTNDPYCGIVNTSTSTTPSEWAFLDKGGNTAFAQGELFEGGIDLSTIAPNSCFASFMVESRASTSPTATLKDFVLAPEFGGCESSMSSDQTWTPEDSATVGVSGVSVWSGTVTFKLYKGGSCDADAGTASGALVYTSSAVPVSNTTTTVSTDDATTQPAAIDESDAGSSTTYWWLNAFVPSGTSASAGVEGAFTCEKTVIAIDDTP